MPTKRSARNRPGRNRSAVEIERNRSRQVGAIGADLPLGETFHHLRPRMAERVVIARRHHRKLRRDGLQEFRRARGQAAVMADLEQVGVRLFALQISSIRLCESPTRRADVSPYCRCSTMDSSSCNRLPASAPGCGLSTRTCTRPNVNSSPALRGWAVSPKFPRGRHHLGKLRRRRIEAVPDLFRPEIRDDGCASHRCGRSADARSPPRRAAECLDSTSTVTLLLRPHRSQSGCHLPHRPNPAAASSLRGSRSAASRPVRRRWP